MQRYDVYHQTQGAIKTNVTAQEIEETYGIRSDDLEWSIEEDGICSTTDAAGQEIGIVEHGDEAPVWG